LDVRAILDGAPSGISKKIIEISRLKISYFYPDQGRTKVNENALKGKKGHLST
jgi:hypothetical protein